MISSGLRHILNRRRVIYRLTSHDSLVKNLTRDQLIAEKISTGLIYLVCCMIREHIYLIIYKDFAAVQSLTELVNWSNTQTLARDLENVLKCSRFQIWNTTKLAIFFYFYFLNHYINWFPINSYVCELFVDLFRYF